MLAFKVIIKPKDTSPVIKMCKSLQEIYTINKIGN